MCLMRERRGGDNEFKLQGGTGFYLQRQFIKQISSISLCSAEKKPWSCRSTPEGRETAFSYLFIFYLFIFITAEEEAEANWPL